jgi:hypothetical protein
MITIEDFCFSGATEIIINDGFIKSIFLEDTESKKKLLYSNSIEIETGGNALIEFVNGKKILITNSEWASINFV